MNAGHIRDCMGHPSNRPTDNKWYTNRALVLDAVGPENRYAKLLSEGNGGAVGQRQSDTNHPRSGVVEGQAHVEAIVLANPGNKMTPEGSEKVTAKICWL